MSPCSIVQKAKTDLMVKFNWNTSLTCSSSTSWKKTLVTQAHFRDKFLQLKKKEKKEDIKQLTSGAWVTKTTIYFPTATHLCMHLHTSCEYVCAVRHANCMKVFATKCTRFNSDRLATVTDETDGRGRWKGSVCRYNVQNKFKPLPPHSTLSLLVWVCETGRLHHLRPSTNVGVVILCR